MSFPRQVEIEIPLLNVLVKLGGQARPQAIYPLVAEYFPGLTAEDKIQRMENSPGTVRWWNMVQWARQKLVEKTEIDGTTHGIWQITDAGRSRLKSAADDNLPLIKKSPQPNTPTPVTNSVTAQRQHEPIAIQTDVNLRDLVNESREQLKGRLITELQALTPEGFEKFCTVFLAQLGYEDLSVTGRGPDGGIDGAGLFRQGVVRIRSAFQAKRWRDSPIGRPEIDRFRGAIQGEYDHGVFLTTSRFSKDAEDASIRRGAISILLLDGIGIANLMIERGLGVIKQPIYLADVDEDFFDFDE